MKILKGKAKIILECLMLIDVQHTTIAREYEKSEWNIHFQKCRDCIPKIEKIVDFFRAHNLPLIHVLTTEWTEKALPWNIRKLYDENPNARFYHEGTPRPVITPLNGELTVRKNMPSAFGGTDYIEENYLFKQLSPIRHITICGFYSTGCVHETIIEGFNRHRYFFNIVRDCCETFDDPGRQAFQNMLFDSHFNYMNGHVIESADILQYS
ncbi:MAG: isochorismatase family protein [Spirochaetales bacterium]|nr:isochorismatase family protein [Spirochaetales bacterium]